MLIRDHFQNFKRYQMPKAHGIEIKKEFHQAATKWLESNREIKTIGYAKSQMKYPGLF